MSATTDTSEAQSFAKALKRYRLAANLSQTELAERAHMSRSAISALERGLKRRPHLYTVQAIVDALRLAPADREALQAAARAPLRPSSVQAVALPVQTAKTARHPSQAPFIGRPEEMQRLRRHLDGDEPALLALAGEPGIGKSRLLHEIREYASSVGWNTLKGRCRRQNTQQPYAPIREALATWIQSRPSSLLRADLAGCDWLARLLPELLERQIVAPPSWSFTPEHERRLLFAAVQRFLSNVAGTAGTLLLLDDLHWAGADTLALIETLAQSDGSLRLIAAYRNTEEEETPLFASLLSDLVGDGKAEQMELVPLSSKDSEALVEALLAQESAFRERSQIARRLAERCGGVPLFLVSCSRAVTATTDTDSEAPADSVIPWDVRQSIQQRLALLPSGSARTLLEIVAVMGRPVTFDLLEALMARSGLNDLACAFALDATLRSRLLVEAPPGETAGHESARYRIGHDLMRDTILDGLGAARSQQLHLAIAEVLEEHLLTDRAGQEWAAELAWHFKKAGEGARALPYAFLAGEIAEAVYAYDNAAHHYHAAMKLARSLGDTLRQAESARRLGHALWLLGQRETALDRLAKAAQMFQTIGDLSGELDTVTTIVQICADRGQIADGLQWAEPLLARAENTGDMATMRARGHLYNGLANLYFMSARYDKQLEAATHAERLARKTEDERALARALLERIVGVWNVSSVVEALPSLLTLIPQVERLRDGWILYRLLNLAAEAHLYRGEFERGKVFQERTIEVIQLLVGEQSRLAFELGNAGNYAYYLGEWSHARQYCEQAFALIQQADPGGVTLRSAYCHLWLGKLNIAEGNTEQGDAQLASALAIAGPRGDLQALRHAQAVLAERDLLAGNAAEAHARLQPLLDRPGLQEPNVTMRLLPLVAWATLEVNGMDEGAERAEEAIARAHASGARFALVDAWRVQALVEIRREGWRTAIAALDNAIALARRMPYPYAEAKALFVSGLLAQAQGSLALAHQRMQAAQTILHGLGERLYASRIESLLAQW